MNATQSILLYEGAKQMVLNCLKQKPGEKVVIITDEATLEIADMVNAVTLRNGAMIKGFFVMEHYGSRPLTEFPEEIKCAMQEADISIYMAQGKAKDGINELTTFRLPMLEIVENQGDCPHLRHAHQPGITMEIMTGAGMRADYEQIQQVTKALHGQLKDTRRIDVSTYLGTDLTAILDPDVYCWHEANGDISQAGSWSNLPDGELFTCPDHISGTLVVDGCLGDYFTEKYGDIQATLVTIEIKDSRAVSVSCPGNLELEKDVHDYLFVHGDENTTRVGEFAFGTNPNIKEYSGNMLEVEKKIGFHVGFGKPSGKKTGANWDSKTHLDCLVRNVTAVMDNKRVFLDCGQYTMPEIVAVLNT